MGQAGVNRPIENAPLADPVAIHRPALRGTCLWDADHHRIAWADPDAIHAWAADSLGDLLDARFDPDDPLLPILTALRDRLEDGQSVIESLRLVAGNGRTLHALCRIAAGPLGDGRPGLRIDILGPPPARMPVADQRGMGEASDGDDISLSALIAAIDHPLVVLDATGTITAANPAAATLFETTRSGMLGRALIDWLSPQDGRTLAGFIAEPPAPGTTRRLFPDLPGPTAETGDAPALALEITAGTVATRGARRYCVLMRDIGPWLRTRTEIDAARDEADRLNRRKSAFLARVSHELRTPMTAVIGFAEILMKGAIEPDNSERTRLYARHIFEAGHHALSLIEDLLDLARIETGRLVLDPAPVDIAGLVADSLTLIRPLADKAGVTVSGRVSDDLPELEADARSLRQILLNLLTQAIRSTAPTGTVSLSAARSVGGGVALRIRDTGRGLPADTIRRILAPSADETGGVGDLAGASDMGTGLALPLARSLAEANGARFSIQSAPGDGTLVDVIFPASS